MKTLRTAQTISARNQMLKRNNHHMVCDGHCWKVKYINDIPDKTSVQNCRELWISGPTISEWIHLSMHTNKSIHFCKSCLPRNSSRCSRNIQISYASPKSLCLLTDSDLQSRLHSTQRTINTNFSASSYTQMPTKRPIITIDALSSFLLIVSFKWILMDQRSSTNATGVAVDKTGLHSIRHRMCEPSYVHKPCST